MDDQISDRGHLGCDLKWRQAATCGTIISQNATVFTSRNFSEPDLLLPSIRTMNIISFEVYDAYAWYVRIEAQLNYYTLCHNLFCIKSNPPLIHSKSINL